MVDPTKVAAKIDELDRASAGVLPKPQPGSMAGLISPAVEPPHIWQEFDGYSALTKFEYTSDGKAVFSPTIGIPVKAFLNTKTGEIRTFLAKIFES